MSYENDVSPSILEAWRLESAEVIALRTGHINRTYRVKTPNTGPFILQRVSEIFGPEIHEDIAAVTARLEAQGVPTPRLVPTMDGANFVESDGLWRLLTYREGETHLHVPSPNHARSAGQLLARFHSALAGFNYTFQNRRKGIHDTPRHLRSLTDALQEFPNHANLGQVEAFADDIHLQLSGLRSLSALPERVVHGDPKISNVLFDRQGQAHCLVDLDTLGRMTLAHELGDAFRSWCKKGTEDDHACEFDTRIFEAALSGYLSVARDFVTEAEWFSLLDGTETIALELAARFATDALRENYFAWDPARFASRSEHNLARARAQIALAASIRKGRSELEAILESVWR